MIDDSKKPLLFTIIVAGAALTVSVPIAYLVGAVVTIAFGTIHDTVGASGNFLPSIAAGLITTTVFVLYTSYATYSFSKAKYIDGTVE